MTSFAIDVVVAVRNLKLSLPVRLERSTTTSVLPVTALTSSLPAPPLIQGTLKHTSLLKLSTNFFNAFAEILVSRVQMPNISFDIFFNEDVVNITASRGNSAPKVKPGWKTRVAPKLPPKEPPQPATAVFAKPSREEESSSSAEPKRPARKLEVRNKKSESS